jgi:L-iditol 2-dehydrogenase
MIEPLACVIRGQRLINLKKSHTVLIMGCGISGLMNIQLAKLNKTKVIATDIDDFRLKKAKEFGADQVINAARNLDLKAERIIICTGAPKATQQAFKCIDRKGIILFFAVPKEEIRIPSADFWRDEITVTSTYGAAPDDLREALNLIKDKKIDVKPMITHRLPLTEIQEGFRIVSAAKGSLKVVLVPSDK